MDTVFDPVPLRQILSYRVRGPEVESLFDVLCQHGPLSDESLSAAFAGTEEPGQPRKDDLVRDALDFLRAVELVGRRDENGRKVYQVLDEGSTGIPFRLLLLRQLHQMTDRRDAFRIAHDVVISRDWFLSTKSDMLKELEGMYPEDYAWNTEKLRSWEWLSAYTGLVRSLDPRHADLMVCPVPDLLLSSLRFLVSTRELEGTRENGEIRVLVGEWLDCLESTLFSCHTESREVHHGLSGALLSMEAAGRVKLDMMSDAPGARLLKDRRISHIRFTPTGPE